MEIYINALSCISHHNTITDDFFFEETTPFPVSNFLGVIPPVYKDYIPANTLRRASHILKMGMSAGLMCLKKAASERTDAILVGTAMGCYEDTDKFLRSVINNDERMLTPTAFIQSTHNTIAGQLALLAKCHGYNFTYVHQNLSFEYALIDAMLLLKEGEAENVLVGGVDEMIEPLCEIVERAGYIKKAESVHDLIWSSQSKGFIAGEGATFFNLSAAHNKNCIAKINAVKTIQKIADPDDLLKQTELFLDEQGLTKENISLVLSGISGDSETDKLLKMFNVKVGLPIAYFKHLCGEYFTSSAFALWFAASILKNGVVPKCAMPDDGIPEKLNMILIVNHYQNKQYSLMCISKC